MIKTIILFSLGFISFFATGIDDTLAYAGIYLKNQKNGGKKFISLGIILGTFIALAIAIFAGSLMEALPSKHLISGAILITLGIVIFNRGKFPIHKNKAKIKKIKKELKTVQISRFQNLKFIGLGTILFFATGIDDLITYSNLIMAKGSWLFICAGVVAATFLSLFIANILSDKLKRFSHPERIGGGIIIIMGILLALKIL